MQQLTSLHSFGHFSPDTHVRGHQFSGATFDQFGEVLPVFGQLRFLQEQMLIRLQQFFSGGISLPFAAPESRGCDSKQEHPDGQNAMEEAPGFNLDSGFVLLKNIFEIFRPVENFLED
jgi:hypothetical protein